MTGYDRELVLGLIAHKIHSTQKQKLRVSMHIHMSLHDRVLLTFF